MSASLRGRAEVTRLRQALDATFKRAGDIDVGALETRSDFAKYLCVLVSGFVERSTQELAHECCRNQASPSVAGYAGAQLKFFRNPNRDQLLQLVRTFDVAWSNDLDQNYADGLDAVNSVVNNRHVIAHGGTMSLSLHDIGGYYDHVKRLVRRLEDLFDPRLEVAAR
jgi:hypothetical protein